MRKSLVALNLFMCAPVVFASSPKEAQISALSVTADYKLEPTTRLGVPLCSEGEFCPYQVLEGTVQIEAATDESGRLTRFDVAIDGTAIPEFDLVSRFGELQAFRLGDASVSFSPGGQYFPRELSERSEPDNVLGGAGAAYVNIGQYEAVDETCEFNRRYISLQYDIEYDGPSIYDECMDDAQIWKIVTFLGCLWNVNDMNREGETIYEKVDASPPFGTPITLTFNESQAISREFASSGIWVFVDQRPIGAGMLLSRYQSANALNTSRRDAYILEREGFEGSVSILGQDHTFFLLSCE